MENYSQYFERIEIATKIKNLLLDFDEKQNNMDYKKGVYIYMVDQVLVRQHS